MRPTASRPAAVPYAQRLAHIGAELRLGKRRTGFIKGRVAIGARPAGIAGNGARKLR
jgi:hypothetical protein